MQWRFQSCQVTRAGDMHGVRGKLGQATCTACAVSLWVEKNPVPPPNRRALDCSVVLTVGRLCPIVPQDNIVVSNKHNWPEFYSGNARGCPSLEPPMSIWPGNKTAQHLVTCDDACSLVISVSVLQLNCFARCVHLQGYSQCSSITITALFIIYFEAVCMSPGVQSTDSDYISLWHK